MHISIKANFLLVLIFLLNDFLILDKDGIKTRYFNDCTPPPCPPKNGIVPSGNPASGADSDLYATEMDFFGSAGAQAVSRHSFFAPAYSIM